MRSLLASVVLVVMNCTPWQTASGQPTTSTVTDTLCFSIQEVRELIDGVALGNAGFERLDAELKIHAHTWGRLLQQKKNVVDLKAAIKEKDGIIEERTNQRDGWKKLYDRDKKIEFWEDFLQYAAMLGLGIWGATR